jgi:hypothetical protein
MKAIKGFVFTLFIFAVVCIWSSCNKSSSTSPTAFKLSYGDSIIYLRPSSNDYIVYPTETKTGTYTAFPDGIELDDRTGAINVSKSETGLRYRITLTAADGTVTSTLVVISGISFPDHFYHLSQGDSVALPIYNAETSRVLPLNGSSFDEGNGANSGGCSVKTVNGQINLAQTVRNGVFGSTPTNDERRDFDIAYRINDASGKSLNKLRVRVYYYNTMADVAPDLMQTLQDRESQGVFLAANNSNPVGVAAKGAAAAKPRPPCVIIIGQ